MKNICVIGGGVSGKGAAILAKIKGYNVFLSDNEKIEEKILEKLKYWDIPYEQERHSEVKILQSDLIIKSPGISNDTSLIKSIRKNKVRMISEIEFASWYAQGKIIAITGSNGKTTTSSLLAHILNGEKFSVKLCGNIGNSFAEAVTYNCATHYVVEVSSFQLEDIETFKPDIAILTSLSPDHLSRYNNNYQEYINTKFLITKNLTSSEFFIYDGDNDKILQEVKKRKILATKYNYSLKNIKSNQGYLNQEKLNIRTNNNNTFQMNIKELALQGRHNIRNSMAAGIAASIVKVRNETLRKCLADFQTIEHRLEPALKIHNIQFINDSKATNVNATYYALESMKRPTVWIVGGLDKGNDYSDLIPLVKEKVRAIVCLGINNKKLMGMFGEIVPLIVDTSSMKEAVKSAYVLGKKGDNVLLSPACASFDLFENYKDRGNQFKEEIRKL